MFMCRSSIGSELDKLNVRNIFVSVTVACICNTLLCCPCFIGLEVLTFGTFEHYCAVGNLDKCVEWICNNDILTYLDLSARVAQCVCC